MKIAKNIDLARLRAARLTARRHGLNWWWLDMQKWPKRERDWFTHTCERSAYIYELSARIYGHHEFGTHWYALDSKTKAQLAERWQQNPRNDWAIMFGADYQEPKATLVQPMSFNLEKNNDHLRAKFLEFIDRERKRTGIYPRPNELSRRKLRS